VLAGRRHTCAGVPVLALRHVPLCRVPLCLETATCGHSRSPDARAQSSPSMLCPFGSWLLSAAPRCSFQCPFDAPLEAAPVSGGRTHIACVPESDKESDSGVGHEVPVT